MVPRQVVRFGSYSLLSVGLALLVMAQLAPSSFFFARRSGPPTTTPSAGATPRTALQADYGRLPLSFEVNRGQAGGAVRFLAHGGGYDLTLSATGATLALTSSHPLMTAQHMLPGVPGLPGMSDTAALHADTPPATVSMAWLGANSHSVITGEDPLPGTVNYFIGNDPKQWHTNIPTYAQVRLHNVYPGVDLVYYGTSGQLEYDFVVAPGADPAHIALGFSGAQRLGVDLAGNVSLSLPGGVMQQDHPTIYQTVNGARQTVAGGYTLRGAGRVGFALGAYNPHLPLVIDPAYRFSTYLGGSADDEANGIAVDSAGSAYVAGSTLSTNFPTTSAYQGSSGGGQDAFVTKLNAAGTARIYSTYLGGSDVDGASGIAVDASGNAYIAGFTYSTNFPTANAFQSTIGNIGPTDDAFVTKLNATGSALIYSTYLGGDSYDGATGIALDSSGEAYVTGLTSSFTFPTANPIQASSGGGYWDAFVSKFNAAGSALVYSTYLGGSGNDFANAIAVDNSGEASVTGNTLSTDFPTHNALIGTFGGGLNLGDAFVTKLNAAGSAFVFSTYLGGTGDDEGKGITTDSSGNTYVTGTTGSSNFPVVNAYKSTQTFWDTFVTKYNPTGSAYIYSTFLGGTYYEEGDSIALDTNGDAYISGETDSHDFPLVNPLQSSWAGNFAVTVSRLSASGSALLFSTVLGGGGSTGDVGFGIAVTTTGVAYVAGFTGSTTFPAINALQGTSGGGEDGFVTKLYTLPSAATTTGVFRPSNGALYLKNSNSTGYADIVLTYGIPGDKPVTGDWTGKGYPSIGVDRNGTFYLRNSNTTGYADITLAFGNSTDLPVAGDWTGKGYDSIGVFRPSTGTWLLRNSNTSGAPDITVRFGTTGDLPVVGDWTGKGYDSIGVFRPSTGKFYLHNTNTTGSATFIVTFGASGDLPVVGDWTAHGYDSIGVDRGGNFLLRNTNTSGPADISFYLGVSGDQPIAGPWLAPQVYTPSHQPAKGGVGHPPTHTPATAPGSRLIPAQQIRPSA